MSKLNNLLRKQYKAFKKNNGTSLSEDEFRIARYGSTKEEYKTLQKRRKENKREKKRFERLTGYKVTDFD